MAKLISHSRCQRQRFVLGALPPGCAWAAILAAFPITKARAAPSGLNVIPTAEVICSTSNGRPGCVEDRRPSSGLRRNGDVLA